MSNSLIVGNVLDRAFALGKLEATARPLVLGFGMTEWPLGDAIKASLADVKSLVARVEELEAALAIRRDEPSIIGMLVGMLRAEGYKVEEPGEVFARGCDEMTAERDRELGNTRTATLDAFNPDAAASDMLGEDEPDDYADESPRCGTFTGVELGRRIDPSSIRAETVATPANCPNCERPLPPNGKCLSGYVDCQKTITAPVMPQADPPTSAETPTTKPRQRTPEPPKLVTEWAPDGRDFEGYAKELPLSASQLEAMLPDFQQFILSTTPDQRKARWGGVFKDWLKAKATNQA